MEFSEKRWQFTQEAGHHPSSLGEISAGASRSHIYKVKSEEG